MSKYDLCIWRVRQSHTESHTQQRGRTKIAFNQVPKLVSKSGGEPSRLWWLHEMESRVCLIPGSQGKEDCLVTGLILLDCSSLGSGEQLPRKQQRGSRWGGRKQGSRDAGHWKSRWVLKTESSDWWKAKRMRTKKRTAGSTGALQLTISVG